MRQGEPTDPRQAALLADLRAAIGPEHVLVGGNQDAWTVDWRKRYRGRALAVVLPASTEQVAQVVRACAAAHTALVPQGGNTGLVGGGVPDASGHQILLSLARMQRIRRVDRANLTMTLDAGCVLQAAQEAAREQELLYPLSLASEGSCTVGGTLATNAGGTQVLRYGNARELCLGLEVVTADGEIWSELNGLRKDNTGYSLRDLFIGSEGTLGVITAATLRLYPRPAAQCTALASCPSIDACVRLLQAAQAGLGPDLSGFEIMAEHAMTLVARHFPSLAQPLPAAPWTVLLETSDTEGEAHAQARLETVLGAQLEAGVISDAAVAQTLAQSNAFWHLRESIPLAQAEEGLNIKHDISLPVSRIPDFVHAMAQAIQRDWPGARLVTFGHLGDGNLHYNIQCPVHEDPARFLLEQEAAINARVYDAVQAMGGSFSAEHGIGALKRDTLAERKSPQALRLMRAVKQALDPHGLFNPGRVL